LGACAKSIPPVGKGGQKGGQKLSPRPANYSLRWAKPIGGLPVGLAAVGTSPGTRGGGETSGARMPRAGIVGCGLGVLDSPGSRVLRLLLIQLPELSWGLSPPDFNSA